MLKIANFRLFFSTSCSSSLLLSCKPNLSPLLVKQSVLQKPAFPLIVSSSSAGRRRKAHPLPPSRSRSSSTFREAKTGNKSMAESEPIGFNKRRAEGRDKNNKPKDLQLKVRKLNPTNTVSYVQILGTGMDTQDTSSSVLLFFDKQRFIFNVGEGLQRFCTEHKIKLSKVDHVFLSRVCSETAGGLPGLLLTLAGMGEEGMSVNVWGPSDFKYLVDAMRSFIPNAAMVHTQSFGAAPGAGGAAFANRPTFAEPIVLVNNEVVKISAILLQPGYSEVHKEKRDQILNFPLSNSQDPNGKALPVQKPGDISVVYVCELPEIMGKFDPAKAVALGLKAGPKYGELQRGNSVMSDRQDIMVHPNDVLGPSLPGPIVVLVDCPTLSHLEELLSTQSLNNFYVDAVDQNLNSVKSVNCVIHLSPSSITMTPEYQNWMKRFGGAQHIMAGHEMKNLKIPVLKSSARIAARLNYLCPQFFPAPGFWSPQHLMNSMPEHITSCEDSAQKSWESFSAENLLKFHLRPYAQLGLDRSGIPSSMTPTEVVNELVAEIPEIVIAAEQVREFWEKYNKPENIVIEEPWMTGNASGSDINPGKQVVDDNKKKSYLPSCLENITREDMEVVLLGTGSSQPSKYRNVTSIYINLFSKGSLLLDCGEGTLGQLKRRFGVKGADDAVRSLRCIWISHIHADHHTGLARILALRRQLLRDVDHEPLLVIGPRQLKSFLDAYQKLEDLDMEFLDCRHTTESSWDAFKDKEESNRNELPPRDPIGVDNKGEGQGVMTTGATLFARGSSMQSYWKKPVSPGNTGMGLLKKLKNVLDKAGLEALVSVPVLHCPQSFGLVLNAAERNNRVGKRIPGWKLVYSGDTRPCQELVDASRGATVLIHEATFEDAMVEEAIEKNHSTTKEAIEVGSSAGAYRIILTHFSQRYPKIPVFDETHMHNTCIAFDMMSINIADLPLLPEVLPYLKLLFKNEMMVDESDEAVCEAI